MNQNGIRTFTWCIEVLHDFDGNSLRLQKNRYLEKIAVYAKAASPEYGGLERFFDMFADPPVVFGLKVADGHQTGTAAYSKLVLCKQSTPHWYSVNSRLSATLIIRHSRLSATLDYPPKLVWSGWWRIIESWIMTHWLLDNTLEPADVPKDNRVGPAKWKQWWSLTPRFLTLNWIYCPFFQNLKILSKYQVNKKKFPIFRKTFRFLSVTSRFRSVGNKTFSFNSISISTDFLEFTMTVVRLLWRHWPSGDQRQTVAARLMRTMTSVGCQAPFSNVHT